METCPTIYSLGRGCCACLVCSALQRTGGESQPVHSLTIISPSSFTLTTTGRKATTKTLLVRNDGKTIKRLRFVTVPAGRLKVEARPQSIGAFSVRSFSVKLTPNKPDQTFKGALAVRGKGVAPGTITL